MDHRDRAAGVFIACVVAACALLTGASHLLAAPDQARTMAATIATATPTAVPTPKDTPTPPPTPEPTPEPTPVAVPYVAPAPTWAPTPARPPAQAAVPIRTPAPAVAPPVVAQRAIVHDGGDLYAMVAAYFPEQPDRAYRVMMCESGGNPMAVNSVNRAHFGLWQFNLATWQSVGGAGNPIYASAAEQTLRARMLYNARGWQPWSCA